MAGKFEVYEDKAGKFRFRLKAGNGEIVAVGEAYGTLAAAKEGLSRLSRTRDKRENHEDFVIPSFGP